MTRPTQAEGLGAIVMAAGMGTRMKSKLAKVLHPVAGRPMVLYAIDLAERLADRGVVTIVGYQGDQVQALIHAREVRRQMAPSRRPRTMVVEQRQQLGTGHAVIQARDAMVAAGVEPAPAYVILNGDTPLLSEETVRALTQLHRKDGATITILTALLEDPKGYGRVVRQTKTSRGKTKAADGAVLRIVEDRDATAAERQIGEINVGTYVVDGSFLFEALDQLEPKNTQNEYYLTDLLGLAVARGLRVSAMPLRDPDEGMGVNTRQHLASAERVLRQRICAHWMAEGVTVRDPATTWIDADVTIGRDTVLYPQVTLEGRTTIGEDCVIRSQTRITDSSLGHRVVVQDACVLREAVLEEDTAVGPFAHLRPGAVLRRAARVGNFVEIKKADLGEGSKANHLSYIGDAKIGKDVNIGAGTITCNYDGAHKHQTIVGDHVFIGSDSQLIAPVTIGSGAVIAAGSTVTEDVPPDALAISRPTQVTRPGWAARRRALPDMVPEDTGGKQKQSSQAEHPDTKEQSTLVSAGGRAFRQGGKR